MEESETEELENDEEKKIRMSGRSDDLNGNHAKKGIGLKTNLEILLSQNDILPLLRKINKDKRKIGDSLHLANYLKKNVNF
jgi:hypothetical protein